MDKQKRERIHYIDIAKGILIICVVITHTPAFAKTYGVDGFQWLESLRPLFNSYFMPAFFCITGFCTNFGKGSVLSFIFKKFKTLVVPNIIVSLGIPFVSLAIHGNCGSWNLLQTIFDFVSTGGFWFLDALFFATLIYIYIYRCSALSKYRLVVSLLFLVIGCAIYYFRLPNPWNIQQALLLLPFVCMGHNLRECPLKKRHEDVMLAIFLLITMCDIIFNFPLGGIMGKISLNLFWFPLLLLQSFCGAIFIIKLSKIIEKSCVLETIGKASLSIYIFHMYFLTKTLPIMSNITMTFLFGLAYISFILLICVVVDKILNTKYLKFVLGKF